MKTLEQKVDELFVKCYNASVKHPLLTVVALNKDTFHAVFQDDRGNTHVLKKLNVEGRGFELWYAGAVKEIHVIQKPIKTLKDYIAQVKKIYSQKDDIQN
jgi:hypothetical protein